MKCFKCGWIVGMQKIQLIGGPISTPEPFCNTCKEQPQSERFAELIRAMRACGYIELDKRSTDGL